MHQNATEYLLNKKKYRKVRDNSYFTGKYKDATHSIYNLRFNVPNEIPAIFYNGSNYDYHFVIKELANELANAERYNFFFSLPINKS